MVAAKPFATGLVLFASLLMLTVQAHDRPLAPRSDHHTPAGVRRSKSRRDGHAAGGAEADPGYPIPPAAAESMGDMAHESVPLAWEAAAPAESWAAPAYTAPPAWETPAPAAYTPGPSATYPTYGSGYEQPPDQGGLEGCLATCSASFGWPAATATATAAPEAGQTGGVVAPTPPAPAEGGAKTHTVIVAPSQGVLKFVPFTINVQPGDTIKYQWGAGPHTVTKSSLLGICNATADAPFNSGRLNKSAEFDQVIGSSDPTFVFCGVQPHCTKGMFSIVNPPTAPANLTAGAEPANQFDPWLDSMAANSSVVQQMVDQAKGVVGNNSDAWAWGGRMVMDGGMEEWAKMAAIENTLWTRMSFATNPSALVDGFSLSSFNAPPSFAQLSSNDTSAYPSGAAKGSSSAAGSGAAEASSTPASAASGAAASASADSNPAGTSAGLPKLTLSPLTLVSFLGPALTLLLV